MSRQFKHIAILILLAVIASVIHGAETERFAKGCILTLDSRRGETRYSYTPTGQLERAEYPGGREQWRKSDPEGNLYPDPDMKVRRYLSGGRLEQDGEWHCEYDADGNLRERYLGTGRWLDGKKERWRYRWNADGSLAKVIRPDKKEVDFTYDALGRRLSKSFGTTVTRWVWNGNVPLHQWKERREYSVMEDRWHTDAERRDMTVWLFDEDSFVPAAMIRGGKAYSILTDQLGTPTEAYDPDGNEVWSRVLDMDGNVIEETGNKGMVPFLFQGQYYDRETGLAYNRFRYYDPKTGAYISQDPIGLAGGMCLYNYVIDTNSLIDRIGWHEIIAILDGKPVLTDKGEILWYSTPGSSDAPYNGYGASGHSEAKLLEALDKRHQVGSLSGKVLDIHSMGQMVKGGVSQLSPLAPCNRCDKGMQEFAIKHNMTIRYHYVDDEGHKKCQHINLNEMDLIKYIKSKIIEKKAILEEIAEGTMLFNPVLSLEKIKQFELKHCINLPSDYKLFLSEIGNGGVGPGLGLKSLYESMLDFKLKGKPCLCLNQEFPYKKEWNESWIASFDWDDDYPDSTIVDHYMDIIHIAGCLQISHKGHGCTYLLVIKGTEFGKIWIDNRADYGGIKPFTTSDDKHLSFGEWYADWITNLV